MWTNSISNHALKALLEDINAFDETGCIPSTLAIAIVEHGYPQNTMLERGTAISIDVWKEAAERWAKAVSM